MKSSARNDMSDPWRDIAAQWTNVTNSVAHDLRAANPGFWFQAGHHATEAFAFRGWASFSRNGEAGEEDLSLTIDFKRVEQGLKVKSDIARGDGYVLADGPNRLIADDSASISDAFGEAAMFLKSQRDLMAGELVPRP